MWPQLQIAETAGTVLGDWLGSAISGTKPVEAIETGKRIVAGSQRLAVTAKNAATVAGDLYGMAQELEEVVGGQIAQSLFGGASFQPSAGQTSAFDKVLAKASPLTITLLNMVALAVADLGPQQQGYIEGLVTEQILEWAALTIATEGGGLEIEFGLLEARLTKILETTTEFAKCERLQALVKALREVQIGGRTAEQIAEDLRTLLNRLWHEDAGSIGPDARKVQQDIDAARAAKAKAARDAKPSGQIHHPISKRVYKATQKHPNLSGQYKPRDPRLTTQALNKAAHNGWQKWHRELDGEVADWINEPSHANATKEQFEKWLRWRYSQPDLKARFPNGF